MAIRLPDMAWVEANRVNLGWSREDLQRALIARIGKPVSLTSINKWCTGGHPQNFEVYRSLVELIDEALELRGRDSNPEPTGYAPPASLVPLVNKRHLRHSIPPSGQQDAA